MARVSSSAVPLLITLDRKSSAPLIRQVYIAIRDAILSGKLRAGTQVPSTRTLARELGVSRTTVVVAYDHLIAEGYIEPISGAGSFVSSALREAGERAQSSRPRVPAAPQLARAAQAYLDSRTGTLMHPTAVPFRIGEPAVEDFPSTLWARLLSRAWKNASRDSLRYGDPCGAPALRQEIAHYLAATRGVKATSEQVIIVRGAQQGLDLAARLLLDPGDVAWMEDPGYPVAREILRGVNAEMANIPTDAEGIDVEEGKRQAENARLAYVAPSHQFPLGGTLSLRRRLELLNWAAENGAWILEDDYDSEFRYDGQPLTALQGLDSARRVIYIGTFSKTVFPAIRLGYLVVPPELVDAFTAARRSIDHMATSVEQLALAEFLANGQFARHVRQMRTLYRARHDVLLEAAANELAGLLRVEPARTGMHVVGWLPEHFDDQSVAAAAFEAGLETPALSTYCTERVLPPGLVLGFAAVDEKAIRSAVTRLAQVLERARRRTDAA